MQGFVDMHCHILPAVDDGSRDYEMACEMMRQACQTGTRRIIFTPHYKFKYRHTSRGDLVRKLKRMREFAVNELPGMKLHLGTECLYEQDLAAKIEAGEVFTMAKSRYVLIEFLPESEYPYIRNAVYEMERYGYIPIVAHIERYTCMTRKTERAAELKEMGALLQINSASVTGAIGLAVKHSCDRWLKEHVIDFIASDAHNTTTRNPQLDACASLVARKYGSDYMEELFCTNAMEILR